MSKLDQLVLELFDGEQESIGDDTPFSSVRGWDSLKHVELIVAVETRFGVELTAEEIERLTSKQSARAILTAKQVDL